MFPMPGVMELAAIFLIALLAFGAKRVPEIGRSLGAAIREFRGAGRALIEEEDGEDENIQP